MPTDQPPFIVAEVSKNWWFGQDELPEILATRFEAVVNANWRRGYRLASWRLTQLYVPALGDNNPPHVNETIIAVFERIRSDAATKPETGTGV